MRNEDVKSACVDARQVTDPDQQAPCPECAARVPVVDGPTHAYYGAAPGCWALYGEVLAREYGDFRFGRVHHLTADTYAAQHPGRPERRTIQSVAVHLIGLHLALERGAAPDELTGARQAAADRSAQFRWLEPPSRRGAVTVRDVHAVGDDPDAHARLVRAWADAVWQAWALHHDQVRAWAAALPAVGRRGVRGRS